MTLSASLPPVAAARRPGTVLAVACVAQFMVVLDIAIVNVALPTIQRDLAVDQSALQWIPVAYGLTLGGFLLLGGRLADLWGHRQVLIAGLSLFTAASLVAGLATSVWLLVAARAAQGLGAALIPPTALAAISATFEQGQPRNRALGLYGAVTGASASVGVVASGLLTDNAGWRWIFLINVPIGIALMAMAHRSLSSTPNRDADERLDVAGALTMTAAVLALVYGLIRGAQEGWGATSVVLLLVSSGLLFGIAARFEASSEHPLVPRAVRQSRQAMTACGAALFTFGALFSFIFLGSLVMQELFEYSPTRTGVAWLAMTLVSFVAAAVTGGQLIAKVGTKWLLVSGQVLLAVAALLMTRVHDGGHYASDLLPALLLAGTAGGLAAPAAQVSALSGVAPQWAGSASGLLETVREVGAVLGVAIVSTVLVSATSAAVSTPGAHGFRSAYWVIVATGVLGGVTTLVVAPRSAVTALHTNGENE